MRRSSRAGRRLTATGLLLAVATLAGQEITKPGRGTVMSFHNRLLLNRHAVAGYPSVEMMLLFRPEQLDSGVQALERLGGEVRRVERAIAYVRAGVPTERVVELAVNPTIAAYQISSFSKGGWYRDGRPQENAELLRGQEIGPLLPDARAGVPDLPLLTPDAARRIALAADRQVGIDAWLSAHPTYDGRGVTIALLESAQLEFEHPAFAPAKTLDGRDVPKFAGIINAIDSREPDDTRVELGIVLEATTAWHRVASRTLILPGPGRYELGTFRIPVGGTLVHEFGVLRSATTREIRVDTDGDGDFREESAVSLSETGIHVQRLHITTPSAIDVAFAVTEGRLPHHLHVYLARDGHQTMTASVAAASRTDDSLAYGVAPGARILLVRVQGHGTGLQGIEGFIDAMQRADVDLVCDSIGLTMLPDSAADFMGLFVSRLIAAYGKPVVHSAGNAGGRLNSVSALGDAFAIGGISEPQSVAALYGGAAISDTIVDPRSAFGPAVDGALKPDFLAPMSRLAAGAYVDGAIAVPVAAPTATTPAGYVISCCTSATSPYAAGAIALLMSAAKQAGLPYSVTDLRRALQATARFLPGFASYEQGSGLLSMSKAWSTLQERGEPAHITISGPIAHVLTPYAAGGSRGPGLFEREGWRAGAQRQRTLAVTRTSGPFAPRSYRLSWTGNDGTFSTPRDVTLPLRQTTSLPVRAHPRAPGAHGAILNVHDPVTGAIIFQTQATIVAAQHFDASTRTISASGALPLLRSATHYVAVPEKAGVLRLVLRVGEGAPMVSLLPGDGQARNYYFHRHPGFSRPLPPGEHSVLLSQPSAGAWGVMLTNMSQVAPSTPSSTAAVSYDLTASLLNAAVVARRMSAHGLAIDIHNTGAALDSHGIDVSTGSLRSHLDSLPANGLPRQIAIDVPDGASTLLLNARGVDIDSVDMFLYDCTSGECFNWDFTLPAGPSHTFVVKNPKPGRWLAAINSAPHPDTEGRFVLEEIITSGVRRHQPAINVPRAHGARWGEILEMPTLRPVATGATAIVLVEVVDSTAERHALEHPWENRPELPNLAERTAAIGRAVLAVR